MTINRLAGIFLIAAAAVSFSRMQAAEDKEASENKSSDANASMKTCFDNVDTWIEGKVTAIDAEKGAISINGQALPFATAHAQMRKEFEQKATGADEEKRQKLAEEINKQWRGKLLAAQGEKPGALEAFELKLPASGEMVLLERKSVQDLQFAYQPDEGPKSKDNEPNLAGVLVSIDLYDVPAPSAATSGATPTAATSPLSMLKVGDTVKAGFDASKKEVLAVIVLNNKGAQAR